MDKLEVSTSLPRFAVSDNASNMVKAINQSGFELYTCLNHTQQLAILDAFKEPTDNNDTMQSASDTCKRLAKHLHKSPLSNMLLEAECEEKNHYPKAIPQANDTRWDSRCNNMVNHEMKLVLKP